MPMNRRTMLLALSVALLPSQLLAGYEDDVVRQLRTQGFRDIEVSRTLLGRSRIEAQNDNGSREIILNPRTGEILRDLFTPNDAVDAALILEDRGDGRSGHGGGDDHGGDDHGDDDHGGDDDDEDDDD